MSQGKLVKKDFDIAKEAGGVDKEVTKPFTAVVTDSTLEIRLYWAGKGTTGIPFRSVYGPLISAISVQSGNTISSYIVLNYSCRYAANLCCIALNCEKMWPM